MADNKNILSIDSDDDDKSYLAFSEYLEEDTQRKKKKTIHEIDEMGEQLLKEIERKNKNKALKSNKLIPYIIKHCDGKYEKIELMKYSYEDVLDIYNEIKTLKQSQSTITKIFHFIFNL